MTQKALETPTPPTLAEHSNGFRLRAETLTVPTRNRVELINITERLAAQVPAPKHNRRTASFRIEGANVVSMVNPAFFEVQRAALNAQGPGRPNEPDDASVVREELEHG